MSTIECGGAIARPQDFESCGMPLRERSLPEAPEVHLWYLQLSQLAQTLQGALSGESDLRNPENLTPAQLRFVRRFYLRLLLGSYLGVPGKNVVINRSSKGKPSIDHSVHDTQLQFSMAKSGDRLLVGISNTGHLGVDLEPSHRRPHNALGVARRYFSPTEALELEKLSGDLRDSAFLRAWACKEAVVKASGLGIANQLCRFTVEIDCQLPPAVLDFDGETAEHWSLAIVEPEEAYVAAVALTKPGIKVQAFRLNPGHPRS